MAVAVAVAMAVHLIASYCVDISAGAREYYYYYYCIENCLYTVWRRDGATQTKGRKNVIHGAAAADGFCYNNFGDVNTLCERV